MSRLLITGATGFLGRALVTAARAAGNEVVALSRQVGPADWAQDVGVTPVHQDLGEQDSVDALHAPLLGVSAVIHAAASFAGDAHAHARNTVGATENIVRACQAMDAPPLLVLVSSLSVYDVASMKAGTTLDEAMPLVEQPQQRDAYAAAKSAQEKAVRRYSGAKKIIRPGAIFGPHRLWSDQLGFTRGGRVLCPGTHVLIPAIEVTRAAGALVHAAANGIGADVVNLIEPDPPTRGAWLSALGSSVVRVPRGVIPLIGSLTGRGAAFSARFRPLLYDTSRAAALLDPISRRPFAEQIAAARQAEREEGR